MRIISFFFLALYMGVSGCSKKDSDSPATRVTYTITDGNDLITSIAFRNANGEMKMLNNYAAFGGPEKTIEVRDKPFEASIKIIVNNTSSSKKSYVLGISVEGEVKKYIGLLVPQYASNYESEELKFVVQ